MRISAGKNDKNVSSLLLYPADANDTTFLNTLVEALTNDKLLLIRIYETHRTSSYKPIVATEENT